MGVIHVVLESSLLMEVPIACHVLKIQYPQNNPAPALLALQELVPMIPKKLVFFVNPDFTPLTSHLANHVPLVSYL